MAALTLDSEVRNGQVKLRKYLLDTAESEGEPNDVIFAESFDDVIKEKVGASDFFERTEFVGGLQELVESAVRRVYGKEETANFLLDTRMGGGEDPRPRLPLPGLQVPLCGQHAARGQAGPEGGRREGVARG